MAQVSDRRSEALGARTGPVDEALADAIEAIVDRRYAESSGPGTADVALLRRLAERRLDRPVYRSEVEATCDALVDADRLVFLRDHGRDGRRYCSTAVPDATVELLRESTR